MNIKHAHKITTDFLTKEYLIKRKSAKSISKEIGCARSLICLYLHKFNIPIRPHSEVVKGVRKPIRTKKHCENLSKCQLGKPKNFPVWNKGKKCPQISGENNPSWKGGLTSDKQRYWNEQGRKRRRLAGELNVATIQIVYEKNIKKYRTLTCYLCLKPIKFGDDCLEHKVPLVRGGTNKKKNLDIAHRRCNAIKYTKTHKEYFEFMKGK